jgi:hypothetical protein
MTSDNPMEQFKGPFIILVVAIIGFAIFYTFRVMGDAYTTGGGSISGDYNIWLHFKLPGRRAGLVKDSQFQEIKGADQEVARRWFAEKLPDSLGAKETQRQYLRYFHRLDSTSANISHEWLLYKWRTDDHYYRRFGY